MTNNKLYFAFSFYMLILLFQIFPQTITTTQLKNIEFPQFRFHFNTIINVSDYTGKTDTEKIQKALNDVPSEGAIVFIPAGTWVAYNLTAKSNTIIMGTNKTILKKPTGANLPFIKFKNCSNFAICYLTFNGSQQEEGIQIENCENFEVFNNTFIGIARRALLIYGKSQNFTLHDNIFYRCNQAPILLIGTAGIREICNFKILNNVLTNGYNNGKIGVAFSSNGIISKNKITNCKYGIGTRCVSNITIIQNKLENLTNYAIYLGTQAADPGTFNILIENNTIVNSRIGIARYYGNHPVINVTIRNNQIVNSSEFDLYDDFPADFQNNIFTAKEKIKLLVCSSKFIGNKDVTGQPIIPGDINNDSKIDMRDISRISQAFGKTSEQDQWNPAFDVIEDGKIDMKDLSFVANHFGVNET